MFLATSLWVRFIRLVRVVRNLNRNFFGFGSVRLSVSSVSKTDTQVFVFAVSSV